MTSVELEKKAKEVLDKIGIDSLPVDIEKIADYHNIVISEAPNDDNLSGLLLRSKVKTIIGTNSLHPKNRKRFTIAHELGHYFLHESEDTFIDNQGNLEFVKFRHKGLPHTPEERDANSFAAALLMPKDLIDSHFNALKLVIDDTEELIGILAKKCEVSNDAMKYRLINLGLLENY